MNPDHLARKKPSAAPRRDDANDAKQREALLHDLPAQVGALWADAVCADELQSRGSIQGGWPCTLPEARSRVAHAFSQRLDALRFAPLTAEELALAVTTAYDHARRRWVQASKQSAHHAARAAKL